MSRTGLEQVSYQINIHQLSPYKHPTEFTAKERYEREGTDPLRFSPHSNRPQTGESLVLLKSIGSPLTRQMQSRSQLRNLLRMNPHKGPQFLSRYTFPAA